MWIFTERGFFSIVASSYEDGEDELVVRARVRDDLEWFLKQCQSQCRIIVTPDRDYRYRVVLDTDVVRIGIAGLVMDIDYTNFKDRVHDLDPSPERSRAYLKVWRAMADLQEDSLPAPVDTGGQRNKSKAAAKRRRKKNKIRTWKS